MPSFMARPLLGRASDPNLALLVIITMTGTVAMHIFVPALPDAAAALNATPFAVQLTMTLYLCGLAGGQLVYGPLSDRFGRRPLLLISLALYLVGLVLAIPAQNILTLILARVLQSLGGCGSLVLGRAMMRDVSTAEDANRKIAVLTIVMALTPALAPALGGLINTWLGWRAIFACLGAVVAALLAIVLWMLPETNRSPIALPGIGAVLAGYLRLLRSAKYRNFLIAGSCCGTSLYAFLAVAPFLLVDVLGQQPDLVGLYCLVVVGGMVAGSFVARQVAGRMEIRKAARRGNVLSLAAAVALLAIDVSGHLSIVTLLVPLTIYSAGVGVASPNAVAGLMNVDPRSAGFASSFYGFSQMVFGALFTLVVALWHGGSAIAVAGTLIGAAFIAMVSLSRV